MAARPRQCRGKKRAESLGDAGLVACADSNLERANAIASRAGARATNQWRDVAEASDVDLAIIATPHDSLAEITMAAVKAGKHVLVEKPAARSAAELEPVVAEAERRHAFVRVGFNHRYHRAFRRRASSSTRTRLATSCSSARATATVAASARRRSGGRSPRSPAVAS